MNTMSARSIISHRMFVAALSHNTNAVAQNRGPDRGPDSAAYDREAARGVPPQYRARSSRAVAARQMLSTVIASGF
jgi:hypothetical protein